MPQTSKRPRGSFLDFLLGLIGGLAVAAYTNGSRSGRRERVSVPASDTPRPRPIPPQPLEPTPHLVRPERAKRPFAVRVAFAATFTVLFFAGAAFTAFGGDLIAQSQSSDPAAADAQSSDATTTTDATATDAQPATSDSQPAATDTQPAATDAQPAPAAAPTEQTAPPVATSSAPAASSAAGATATATATAPGAGAGPASAPTITVTPSRTHAAHVVTSHAHAPAAIIRVRPAVQARRIVAAKIARAITPHKSAPDPSETNIPGTASVVWLNRALPDPTPPAARLARPFVRSLWATSKAAGADWALVLGVLRAEGANGRYPATKHTVELLATQLGDLKAQGKDDWSAAASVVGDSATADKAVALAHYDRAVGIETLVEGLDASKHRLVNRILNDPSITIYPGGRDDLINNRVNVRVVAVIAYLADTFGTVDVSCLISGHRLYARPGVISAHIYGLAVDIAALGGVPIEGHQQPGGLTEDAVRSLLLLPNELMPKQIISLLSLGGPSFALADHYDHIHIGY